MIRRFKFVVSMVLLLALALPAGVLAASPSMTNSGFETGDLTGWTVAGDGSAQATTQYVGDLTYSAWSGSYFALLYGYSAGVYTTLSQTFSAAVGDTIEGAAFFDARDALPWDDDCYLEIRDGSNALVASLFTASVSSVGGGGQTVWTPWSYTFTTAGTYKLVAGVRNVLDNILTPYMGLDLGAGSEVNPLFIQKALWASEDMGDGDYVLEVGEQWYFGLGIAVANMSIGDIDDVVILDNLPGDLLLNAYMKEGDYVWKYITQPTGKGKENTTYTDGFITVNWSGKTNKVKLSFDVGTLVSGEMTYVYLWVITDINPGGNQEYTAEGYVTLNSGATAKGLLDGKRVSAVSNPIDGVYVYPPDFSPP